MINPAFHWLWEWSVYLKHCLCLKCIFGRKQTSQDWNVFTFTWDVYIYVYEYSCRSILAYLYFFSMFIAFDRILKNYSQYPASSFVNVAFGLPSFCQCRVLSQYAQFLLMFYLRFCPWFIPKQVCKLFYGLIIKANVFCGIIPVQSLCNITHSMQISYPGLLKANILAELPWVQIFS